MVSYRLCSFDYDGFIRNAKPSGQLAEVDPAPRNRPDDDFAWSTANAEFHGCFLLSCVAPHGIGCGTRRSYPAMSPAGGQAYWNQYSTDAGGWKGIIRLGRPVFSGKLPVHIHTGAGGAFLPLIFPVIGMQRFLVHFGKNQLPHPSAGFQFYRTAIGIE